tara:strand:+ start:29555 stop:31153 length:1599 start_codon:yes stop_codon:yes gene_type:complete
MKLSPELHKQIYYVALMLIAAGLPFWLLLISIAEIILFANWLIEGDLKSKWKRFYTNLPAVGVTSIFILHVIGLLWTNEDFSYALKDLRVKLPLILFPVVMSTSPMLTKREVLKLLGVFIGAVFLASIVCVLAYFGIFGDAMYDAREMSVFISHIRFSLLVTMAIFSLFYIFFYVECKTTVRAIMIVVLVWLLIFLFILKSMSGIIAFFLTLLVMLAYFTVRINNRLIRSFALISLVAIPLFLGLYLAQVVVDYFTIRQEIVYAELPVTTTGGEKYYHFYGDQQKENGYYVNYYIAPNELKEAWSKRSSIPIDSLDLKGQPLSETVKRFLTSKGLYKDREGVSQLSDKEVHAIENGVANVRYMSANKLEVRIHKIIWEFDNYVQGHNPEGNSVTQRLEFWKTGWYIFESNPIIGVGTGDVPIAFKRAYEETGSPLSSQYQLRGHNQYLTIALTFGVVGIIWFVLALILPFFTAVNSRRYFYIAFFCIAAASMINEDTLETQVGATFFAFFMSLFLFSYDCKDPECSSEMTDW